MTRTDASPMKSFRAYRSWRHIFDAGHPCSPEWSDFRVFLADMGERSAGRQLARADVSMPYGRGNCLWANSRDLVVVDPGPITWRGRTQSLSAWAREVGLSQPTLHHRIAVLQWPLDKAMRPRAKRASPSLAVGVACPPPMPDWAARLRVAVR